MKNLAVVLVRSIYPRNVGSVARVMANMGGARLILIDPKCDPQSIEARQGAAGAQTHLIESTTYSTWDDFYKNEPDGIRIAFCGIEKKDTDTIGLEKRLGLIKSESPAKLSSPLYFIFGPEDYGLNNEDVKFASFITTLPTYGPYFSLNLSHAALLAIYIAQKVVDRETLPTSDEPEAFNFPEKALTDWLEALRFEVGDRRTDALKILRRVLLRNLGTPKDYRILEAILFQTVRKLREADGTPKKVNPKRPSS